MGDTEKIARIVRRCAGGVSIEFNQHRSSYWSPSEEIDRCDYDVPLALRGEMDATDTMVVVQAYPDTPNSFYVVAHTNLTAALDEMLTTLGELIRVDESNIDYDPNDWLQP